MNDNNHFDSARIDTKVMKEYRARVEDAAKAVEQRLPEKPQSALILGTGLGALAREIEDPISIPYGEIPGFPMSTAPGHAGTLHYGSIGGTKVLAFEGRFHLYEGYTPLEITMPVRLVARLGVSQLIISNACGGMNRSFEKGDLMVLDDHINFLGINPLTGPNVDDWGPRFPDMSAPYDPELVERLLAIAKEEGIRAHKGSYVAVPGPNLETRAEYTMLARLGADVVGMSTVPEVIVAVHEGIRTAAISIVTDLCFPEALEPVSVEEILQVAGEAEPKLTSMVKRLLSERVEST